jgi:hypothetical protein
MSEMTSISNKSRQQVSHEQDLHNTSVLCSIVANIAVVAADVELRQTRLRRKGTRNVVRKYRNRKQRFVEDIYNALDQFSSGGHIKCNTLPSRHLLMKFVHIL